ncbi:MAG: NADH-quinone oxidoreductase subunit NuoH [Desulfobacterales bacterium]|jgi:NADH-quinone oxidoreductase subunit H|nr:NADH-quinone oxidoreductase subunit NuoH [Desulfobacterales bacterium]
MMNILELIPAELIRILIGLVAILVFIALNALILVYVERKVAGFIQRRPGPYEVGPWGILQTLVDAVKLMGKQLFSPTGGDRLLFWAAPLLAFAPLPLLFLSIPVGKNLVAYDANLGLILILAFSGLNVLALCLAGWGSYNKWSLLGAVRSVSQAVAYEIPLLLTVLAVTLMTGTLQLSAIVESQGAWPWQWNWLVQPAGFVIFVICALAETNRAPFDLPEAESELTAGFHTEYSGMGFGLFFLAEYTAMVVVSSMCTILFLGGWKGPGPEILGVVWFFAKVYALVILMMWMRWTFPRVRFDQLLNISWRWLIPLSLFNLLYVALVVKI